MTYRDRDRVAEVIIVPVTEHICGAEDSLRCIPCAADCLRELIDHGGPP